MGVKNSDIGWLNCTQCGWGHKIQRWEVSAGDISDGQTCESCGLGPCRIDWTWPDGPGWSYGATSDGDDTLKTRRKYARRT